MLKLEAVHAGYAAKPVLHGVDLDIAGGERLAVLGRNGVGKTTLVRALVGSLPIRSGRMLLNGVDVTGHQAHRRSHLGIACVPQGRDIFPELTVLENMKVAAVTHHRDNWRSELDRALDSFPALKVKARAAGGSLSGGQQQILAIARALLTQPKVLLLDEPSEGIQPSVLDEIVEVVLEANGARGMAIVIVEQNLQFAARVAERSVVMERGRITTSMPIRRLLEDRQLQRQMLAV